MGAEAGPANRVEDRVVLLRDAGWPEQPGVCCWRDAVSGAFDAVGVKVVDAGQVRELEPTDVALVVAESFAAAEAAVAHGVPGWRVWALALPTEPLQLGVADPYRDRLAQVAARIGGFLTDSELARESVERATASGRPEVEVFPPLAVDRTCPHCVAGRSAIEVPDHPAPEVALLASWRAMMDGVRAGEVAAVPYRYPAARLRGLGGPWAPGWQPGWHEGPGSASMSGPTGEVPDWSTAAQVRTARSLWRRVTASNPAQPRPRRTAVVAGFNLKFAVELAARLDRRADLAVTLDAWQSQATPSERTDALVNGADAILAEWARPSAAWLSRQKRPDQILIVRLHRFELETPHPREIDIERVDAVVYVSPPYGRRIRDELDWPVEKLVHIPNFLDVEWFDRPKLPEARFGIGMVGIEPMRKRFDLALDLLAEVRRVDRRFSLFVRSVLPWESRSTWRRAAEREHFNWCVERIRHDPLLRGAVVFDPPGRDMARWYRQVGHVLSTSDDESFHMAPAEGMASGAVPVLRPWPGAAEIYHLDWMHVSVEAAAAAILANADPHRWRELAARARAEVRRMTDPVAVVEAWADLLHGDVVSARSRFARQAPF